MMRISVFRGAGGVRLMSSSRRDEVASQVTISEADLRKEYDAHQERFRQAEEPRQPYPDQAARMAMPRHSKGQPRKAEALWKQVKANPADFARPGRELPGSGLRRERGGDLGFFARGFMVKPFGMERCSGQKRGGRRRWCSRILASMHPSDGHQR